jgi:glycine oxidase
VAGAGAIGSLVALELARAGHRVTVIDPRGLGDNASGVAAGMLAPAFEALFDETSAGSFDLLAAARDAWLALDIPLAREGALAVGTRAEAEAWAEGLQGHGAAHRLLGPVETGERAPALGAAHWSVFSAEDWRLEPLDALGRLRSAAEALGARFLSGEVIGLAAGQAELRDGRRIGADLLVVATGAGQALAAVAPEISQVRPVKGHILRAAAAWPAGPAIRAPGLYLCRTAGGVALGATMEAGLDDAMVDPGVAEGLLARGTALVPWLARFRWRASAGVRGATCDGLPLVGASHTPGVVLAVGARRNGWLLAPLIAAAVARSGRTRCSRRPALSASGARLLYGVTLKRMGMCTVAPSTGVPSWVSGRRRK